MENLKGLTGGRIMKHLPLGLLALITIVILMQYRVVTVNFDLRPIHKNAKNITIWIAEVLIKAIISNWLK